MDRALVLCLGEPLVALTPDAGLGLAESAGLTISQGGAEANVAVGLARLGIPTRYAGAVGDDPFGVRIRSFLAAEQVDISFLRQDPDRPTGFYFKDVVGGDRRVRYHRAGSAAAELAEIDPHAFDGVTHVHVTGVAAALGPRWRDRIVGLLDSGRWTSSFDVNFRPTLWSAEQAAPALLALAARAGTVFVGLDEAATLWGTVVPEEVDAQIRGRTVREHDPGHQRREQEIVVKNDDVGATVFTASGRYHLAPDPARIVEPVGAGDAFAAGYLGARLRGADSWAGLRLGHRLAAAVLAVPDDVAPPLDPAEVDALLRPDRREPTR